MNLINKNYEGFFITFEGLDKTGKTTQINILKQYLQMSNIQNTSGDCILDRILSEKGNPDKINTILNLLTLQRLIIENNREFVFSREPGGTPKAEDIRGVILEYRARTARESATSLAEALLFAASRAQHAEKLIAPELEKGNIVICDRYVDSSLLFQGAGTSLGIDLVSKINEIATLGIYPDLTIFFILDFDVWLKRVTSNDNVRDLIESKPIDYHENLYYNQNKVIELGNKRIVPINVTSLTIDEVALKVSELLLKKVKNAYILKQIYDEITRQDVSRLVRKR